MQEWVDQTVRRVSALAPPARPRDWLRFGPPSPAPWTRRGTLRRNRLFPSCTLLPLRGEHARLGKKMSHVELLEKEATDLVGIEGEFDAVVINSVIQYFPNSGYLVRVLKGAAQRLAPCGEIFVGDVRSLRLPRALRASVELHNAPDALPVEALCNACRGRWHRRANCCLIRCSFALWSKTYRASSVSR